MCIYIPTDEECFERFNPNYVPPSLDDMKEGASLNGCNNGELNPMFGKTHSDEAKRRLSLARRGKCSEALLEANQRSGQAKRGISHSQETKNRISEALKGRVMTEEHKSNLSKANVGRPVNEETREKLRLKNSLKSTCPHCNKTGGGSAMKRYHFDNCKSRFT